MTIEQCYQKFGGDFADTSSRIPKESLLKKLLLKFREDASMAQLEQALAEQNTDVAFQAAHTLKGVSLNMGFTAMGAAASALTEIFRGGSMEGSEALFQTLRGEYQKILEALDELD